METVTVRMARGERNIPWGFGVAEGAKGQAIIVNIVGGSLAERAGLRNGDEIEGVEGLNNLDINAVDRLLVTSRDRIELIIHRHSSTSASVNQTSQQQQQQTRIWRPDVQESGDSHRPFKVSLEHSNDSKPPAGFNSSALPFQADPRVKHLQYNSPMGLYSNDNVAESYNQQTTGYVETPRVPAHSQDQPSYLRSETLRLLKEQEAQRGTPTLSQHPNPAGLPLCFVCNRKILGLLARAAGHDLHADCFQCATCGNSLKNVGHHFVENKFYCDIHGRQKKDLIGAAGQTPLHPHTAVQAPLTSIRPNQTHANAGSFYQPDNLSRPAPQSINTHHITVNVTNPKTQGPISPAQRGIPTNSVFTGDRTTTTKSSSSSSEHFRNSSQPSSYNLNTTNNVPNLPVQAPPPLPQTELHVNVNDRKTNLLSPSRSNESRIPLSVRDAVSPRSVKSPRQWPPPHNLSTNRYWIIDPVGKAKAEKTSVTLQDLIKNEELELHLDDLLEEKSLKTLFSPLTGTNGNAVEPRIENGIHWTVISGPVKHNFRSTSSCEANDRNCEDNQFSNPDEKRSHNTLKCNESECSETQHSSNVDIPQIQLTRADLESSVNENQITESQTSLKVISRQDSSTSPIPVIKFERNASGRGRVPFNSDFQMDFSKTIKVVTEDQLSTNYDNPTFVLNSSPHPYDSSRIGGAGEKRVEFKSSANFVNSEKRWSESNHIVDESDILTDNSRRSDESIDDSNIESRLTAAPYDGDVSEFGKSANTTIEDEQEEWMREEVEQAKQEQIEENASSAAISMRVNNIQSEEVSERGHSLRGIVEDRCIGEDDQRQRDLAIVAALHDRIHDIREMEDQDRLRAIECIERHQQDLEDQQDQLSLLLNSAIQYLRTFDTPETVETRVLNELKTSSDFDGDSKPLIDYPPLPPARSNKSPPAPPERRCFKVLSPSFDSSNIGIEEIITRSNFTNTAKEVASDRLITQLSNKLKAYDDTAVSSFHNNEFQNQSTTKSIYPSSKIGNGNLSQQHTGGRTAFCEACKQHIRGAFVLASGLSWCPEHFICANNNCGRRLLECGFVEEGGHKYCECCFEAYIAPKCSKCTKPIISDCLNALQKKWHPTCFTCTHCQKPFGNNAFYLENGQAFCEADWNMLFTTKCVNCKFAIEAGDRWVEALGSAFHSNCFNCSRCMINLEGESFFAKNGEPFCKLHA